MWGDQAQGHDSDCNARLLTANQWKAKCNQGEVAVNFNSYSTNQVNR